MTPIEKVNLRGGGALPTIRRDNTKRARKAMHAAGNHDRCSAFCVKRVAR